MNDLKTEITNIYVGNSQTHLTGKVKSLRPKDLEHFLKELDTKQCSYVKACGFEAETGEMLILPSDGETLLVLWGIPERFDYEWPGYFFSSLAKKLPDGIWAIEAPEDIKRGDIILGYILGRRNFSLKSEKTSPSIPKLFLTQQEYEDEGHIFNVANVLLMARSLITMPANQIGPQELKSIAGELLENEGAKVKLVTSDELQERYPLVHFVGMGSQREPAVVCASWQGSHAGKDAPLISFVGKGVCFDTGGLDLKGSKSMLKMKKDMGGAATALALCLLIMKEDLPVRLEIRLGCVENAISGGAMRPLDIVKSRKGLTVEIGNTDAEGRLVLADLLTEASEATPDLLVDMATLTGSARSALGPDIPALFCEDKKIASLIEKASQREHDPLWRLPLWGDYKRWLSSCVADINNTASCPMGGSITAALFLQAFIPQGQKWAHVDSYAWHDSDRPGRPEGGDAFGVRALFEAIKSFIKAN